jgi:hypothetical protein
MPSIQINRAPVLTLWAAVVAERLGFDPDEALTLGRAVAGLTAHAKGVRLGIIEPTPKEIAEQRKKLKHGEQLTVSLLGRAVPVVRTPEGIRAPPQLFARMPSASHRLRAVALRKPASVFGSSFLSTK